MNHLELVRFKQAFEIFKFSSAKVDTEVFLFVAVG